MYLFTYVFTLPAITIYVKIYLLNYVFICGNKEESTTWRLNMADRKTYTVRIEPELMKSLKMLAVARELNVSDLLEEAVLEMLKKSGVDGKKSAKK